MHYYLGRGYVQADQISDAVAEFKKVLMINGSHVETMKELLQIYEEQDDRANVKKFSEKIRMIEEAQAEDQAKLVEDTQKENKRIEDEEPEPIPEESRESFDTSELDEFEPESALAAADEAAKAEADAAVTEAETTVAPGDADAEEAVADTADTVETEPAEAKEKGLRKAKIRPRSRKQ